MLSLRLVPIGKKNQKVLRVVLQEKRSKLHGKAIHQLGWWNPRLKQGEFKAEAIQKFISNGAEVSDTLWNLLIKKGAIRGKKRAVKVKAKKEKKK